MARPNNPGPCKAAEINRAKTHCPKGHAYTPENTYHRNGARACRACHAIRARKWQIRRGAAQAIAYF